MDNDLLARAKALVAMSEGFQLPDLSHLTDPNDLSNDNNNDNNNNNTSSSSPPKSNNNNNNNYKIKHSVIVAAIKGSSLVTTQKDVRTLCHRGDLILIDKHEYHIAKGGEFSASRIALDKDFIGPTNIEAVLEIVHQSSSNKSFNKHSSSSSSGNNRNNNSEIGVSDVVKGLDGLMNGYLNNSNSRRSSNRGNGGGSSGYGRNNNYKNQRIGHGSGNSGNSGNTRQPIPITNSDSNINIENNNNNNDSNINNDNSCNDMTDMKNVNAGVGINRNVGVRTKVKPKSLINNPVMTFNQNQNISQNNNKGNKTNNQDSPNNDVRSFHDVYAEKSRKIALERVQRKLRSQENDTKRKQELEIQEQNRKKQIMKEKADALKMKTNERVAQLNAEKKRRDDEKRKNDEVSDQQKAERRSQLATESHQDRIRRLKLETKKRLSRYNNIKEKRLEDEEKEKVEILQQLAKQRGRAPTSAYNDDYVNDGDTYNSRYSSPRSQRHISPPVSQGQGKRGRSGHAQQYRNTVSANGNTNHNTNRGIRDTSPISGGASVRSAHSNRSNSNNSDNGSGMKAPPLPFEQSKIEKVRDGDHYIRSRSEQSRRGNLTKDSTNNYNNKYEFSRPEETHAHKHDYDNNDNMNLDDNNFDFEINGSGYGDDDDNNNNVNFNVKMNMNDYGMNSNNNILNDLNNFDEDSIDDGEGRDEFINTHIEIPNRRNNFYNSNNNNSNHHIQEDNDVSSCTSSLTTDNISALTGASSIRTGHNKNFNINVEERRKNGSSGSGSGSGRRGYNHSRVDRNMDTNSGNNYTNKFNQARKKIEKTSKLPLWKKLAPIPIAPYINPK